MTTTMHKSVEHTFGAIIALAGWQGSLHIANEWAQLVCACVGIVAGVLTIFSWLKVHYKK